MAPVYWSDNFITLFPGEKRVVTAETAGADKKPVLRVRGFNVVETLVLAEN
ncbi:MAG: hypothetical protein BWX80_00679 [Candidatus Hydrogenedentes bacterium ADurb.Bin101]|nr:MAG: hypothetical protein BWX80_00679 [Candidatus Hydrogenedentes bacterium ADurb.Bin101]